jgi:hypothetical protein
MVETTVEAMFLIILLLGVIRLRQHPAGVDPLRDGGPRGARIATTGGTNENIATEVKRNLSRTGNVNDVPGAVAVGINPSDIAARTFNSTVKVEVWWRYPIPVPVFQPLVKERELYARKEMVVTVGN